MAALVRGLRRVGRVDSSKYLRFLSVSTDLIKKLRKVSGAPIKDCKKALTETDGSIDDALEWMRKQGTKIRGKREDNEASQGLVGICAGSDETMAIVELNTETDSAARLEQFHELVQGVSKSILEVACDSSSEELLDFNRNQLEELPWKSITVKDAISDAVLKIRENMFPNRGARVSVPGGVVAGYVHNVAKTNIPDVKMGAIGVVVGLKGASSEKSNEAKELAHKLAMHVAAARPEYLSKDEIPEVVRQSQESLLSEVAKSEGKPDHVIEKMVKGRMQKFYGETCLLDQTFLIHDGADSPPRISKLLQQEGEKLGTSGALEITGFRCFRIGESV